MGRNGCAMEDCSPSKEDHRHRFPDPVKRVQLFLMWLNLTCNVKLRAMAHKDVYRSYRICSKHFVQTDFGPNNTLKKHACPTLFLPRGANASLQPSTSSSPLLDHDYYRSSTTISPSRNIPQEPEMRAEEPEDTSAYLLDIQNTPMPLVVQPDINTTGLLRLIGEKREKNLSPREKRLYHQAKYYKQRSQRLFIKKNSTFKDQLLAAQMNIQPRKNMVLLLNENMEDVDRNVYNIVTKFY